MTIKPYLAMTAWEFQKADPLPQSVAWMACHFSAYGTGLTNIPYTLPEESILILNDRIPMHGHDPDKIAAQLAKISECLRCSGVLLDFQRPEIPEMHEFINKILEALSCPAAVSDVYAADHSCAVFLPPCPPNRPLQAHLENWQGREIWLELSSEQTILTLTESGMRSENEGNTAPTEKGFKDNGLHCHYQIKMHESSAEFILWRDITDTASLLRESAEYGVTRAIGFYQQYPTEHWENPEKME